MRQESMQQKRQKKASKKKSGTTKKKEKRKESKKVTNKDEEPATFRGMIAIHNKWRAKVGSPPLRWSDSLAEVAQDWSDQLKKTRGCKMKHRQPNQFGENIYWSKNKRPDSEDVVNSWASEIEWYDYPTNRCQTSKVCGHYTQVVWNSTKEVGCGIGICGNEQVWVCNYDPPGNWVGKKPY